MTRTNRRILFYCAVFLFIVSSGVAVVYAQGYKYSFSEARFLRTGAVSVDANTEAKVFLDDELRGTTSFLSGTFSVRNLLPGQYHVRLEKEGYSAWQKQVGVQEGLLSDFSRALLLPTDEDNVAQLLPKIQEALDNAQTLPLTAGAQKRTSTSIPQVSEGSFTLIGTKLVKKNGETELVLGEGVNGFARSPDQSKLLWWTSYEVWVLWDRDSGYQPYRTAGETALITRFSSVIKRAGWFPDDSHVVLDTNGYKIVELDTRGGINIIKL